MCWSSWRYEQADAAEREHAESASLRIGDAERNETIEALKQHCADGRITLDEYSDRLDEVYAAHTNADLARALRDLPRLPRAVNGRRARRGFDLSAVRFPVPALFLLLCVLGGAGFFWGVWPLLIVGFCVVHRSRRAHELRV
jgi:uncharacterized protein DUF1707